MNDEPFQHAVGAWLRDEDPAPPHSLHSARQVAARLPLVRQQSRWWPLPLLRRTPTPHRAIDTIEYQPSPIPATNGHTPTVIGRTSSMLSPAKAIIAGALVIGIGGVMLVARPFQQPSSVPGAELQPPAAVVSFTSTYRWSNRSTEGSVEEYEDGVTASIGDGWMFDSLDSTDPRFDGPLVLTMTDIEYPGEGSIAVGGYRIETDDGAWQQVPAANMSREEDFAKWSSGELPPADNIQFWTFTGEGAYEGFTAVVQETWWPDGGVDATVRFDGLVFKGDLWDAPEPWVP